MKKILSLCLTIVMMVSLLACFTVNAVDANNNYTLRRENFGIPVAGVWEEKNVSGDMQTIGCIILTQKDGDPWRNRVAQAKSAGATVSAEIYVDTAGTYTAFMNVAQNGTPITLSIDGQSTTTGFGATEIANSAGVANPAYSWAWEKADRNWTLSAGWNTVTVTADTGAEFAAIFITDQTSLAVADITYNRDSAEATIAGQINTKVYEDFTAPVISNAVATPAECGDDEVTTSVDLTWDITEALGIAKCELYNGTELVADVTGLTTYTASGLDTGSTYNFIFKATDYFNHMAEATVSATTNGVADGTPPEWQGSEIIVENGSFSSTITWPEATDNKGTVIYEIYDGSVDASNLIGTASNNDPYPITLDPSETKHIIVVAKDLSGNSVQLATDIASTAGSKHFVLRQENIDKGEGGKWDNAAYSSSSIGGFILNSNGSTVMNWVCRGVQAGTSASAKIWVDESEAGEYAVFMNVQKNGGGIHLAINGQSTTTALGSELVPTSQAGTNYFGWEKADTIYNLVPGWNTITLTSVASYEKFLAIYITNGTETEADEITYMAWDTTVVADGKINIANFDDVTGPAYEAGNIEASYSATFDSATISWPAAIDTPDNISGTYNMCAVGTAGYKVYVNGTAIGETETTSIEVNETTFGRALVPGETISVRVDAFDVYGNKTSISRDMVVSKFLINSFKVENSSGEATTLSELNDGTVKATLAIKNTTLEPVNIRLSIAIYDADENLIKGNYILDTLAADGVEYPFTAIIPDAPLDLTTIEGCKVKAHLWNADDLTPMVSTIVISE